MNNTNLDAVQDIDTGFLNDVLSGLGRREKELQCKYFYDERGSQLFDQICELDEYYLTRTEQWIMDRYVADMAGQIGQDVMLIEFGSGSSVKSQTLLSALQDPVAYVPVDISEEHLLNTAEQLKTMYPEVEILPIVADFTKDFDLPSTKRKPSHAAVYFPGSTIGNFTTDQAAGMLARFAKLLGPQGGLLIGIDLQKDPEIINLAYNDSEGTTAEFNLNLLHRINRELGGNFDVDQFEHRSVYSEASGRVEIFIDSCIEQTVTIAGTKFKFEAGESILTEYSHKYRVDGFAELAASCGFSLHKTWSDDEQLFAVLHLVNEQTG